MAFFIVVFLVLGARAEVYKTVKAAEAAEYQMDDVKIGWAEHAVARGGRTFVTDSFREYDMSGNVINSRFGQTSKSLSGAIVAVPIGDFVEEKTYEYYGLGRNGVLKKLQGKLISVELQVSCGAKTPSNTAMQRTIENLVKSGIALPKSVSKKPCHIRSLIESVKERFGSTHATPRYAAHEGKIYFLLRDCDATLADETFLPATPKGLTKEGRKKLAKALERSEDKGGDVFITTETQIHPKGSPNAPKEAEWELIN